ncbi:MAG: putative methyltransferase sLL0829 [Candidatus Saccharibacteria bacterium]|nr:putative methyltransferase sLL0829 [Candidatus Saccharibacteria bacterium]
MIPDQLAMWDRKHGLGEHAVYREGPLPFAERVEPLFPRTAEVLELGCGVGGDAYFFATKGHHITATDYSGVVIKQNHELRQHPTLKYSVLDLTEVLPCETESVDVVYAHLSLHYYDHETTKTVFAEIARVLKLGGLLCFACKSIQDSDYGKGEEVEPNLFISAKGHVRHFFTSEYVEELMSGLFEIETIDESEEHYVNKTAAFVRCIARKAGNHE